MKRFREGLPIKARPVGPAGRVWRWCRRKPALAAAASLSVLTLIAVATVSTVFAVFAQNAAHRLEGEQKKTETALGNLRKEHDLTEKARRLAERRLGENSLDTALTECTSDAAHGMLYLAQALQDIPDHADDLVWMARMNLTAWSRIVPQLRWVWPHETRPHGADVKAEFSRDGKYVLTAGVDGTARVWSTATGQPISPPLRPGGLLSMAALSADGQTVATAGTSAEKRNEARLWNVATGLEKNENY